MSMRLDETVTFLKSRYAKPISMALVLGSGMGEFADTLPERTVIPYDDIPHFPHPKVEGHAGNLVLSEICPGFTVACMQGRFHYYEGHDIADVVFPIRALRQTGAQILMVTNACGGIRADLAPGDLMLIEDHLNLTGINPLRGLNDDRLGPRFVDMSEAYSRKLITLARQAGERTGVTLKQGVYAGLTGPTYETPAEIRMLRTLGADAVGMSTVPEVIAARHMGMRVLGLSTITNHAAGISETPLNHAEVLETAERVKPKLKALLNTILREIAVRQADVCLAHPESSHH
jgi:purine-nucleoside phosphorylase